MLTAKIDFVMSSVGILSVGLSLQKQTQFNPANLGCKWNRANCIDPKSEYIANCILYPHKTNATS